MRKIKTVLIVAAWLACALAMIAIFTGCSYISATATLSDGTVIKARYVNLIQDRTWRYNPKTGEVSLGASNEPAQVIIQTASPLVKGAGL